MACCSCPLRTNFTKGKLETMTHAALSYPVTGFDISNDPTDLVMVPASTVDFLTALDGIPELTAVVSASTGETLYAVDGYTVAIAILHTDGTTTFYLPLL